MSVKTKTFKGTHTLRKAKPFFDYSLTLPLGNGKFLRGNVNRHHPSRNPYLSQAEQDSYVMTSDLIVYDQDHTLFYGCQPHGQMSNEAGDHFSGTAKWLVRYYARKASEDLFITRLFSSTKLLEDSSLIGSLRPDARNPYWISAWKFRDVSTSELHGVTARIEIGDPNGYSITQISNVLLDWLSLFTGELVEPFGYVIHDKMQKPTMVFLEHQPHDSLRIVRLFERSSVSKSWRSAGFRSFMYQSINDQGFANSIMLYQKVVTSQFGSLSINYTLTVLPIVVEALVSSFLGNLAHQRVKAGRSTRYPTWDDKLRLLQEFHPNLLDYETLTVVMKALRDRAAHYLEYRQRHAGVGTLHDFLIETVGRLVNGCLYMNATVAAHCTESHAEVRSAALNIQ